MLKGSRRSENLQLQLMAAAAARLESGGALGQQQASKASTLTTGRPVGLPVASDN